MILAVTGATGFLGRAFVDAALDAGHEIRALVRSNADAPHGVTAIEGALPGAIPDSFFEGADAVVHLAACGVQARDRDWTRASQVNVEGSVAVVRQAAAANVRRVVLVGTCLEYEGFGKLPGSPTENELFCTESSSTETSDAYGATKAAGGLAARAAAREARMEWWYLRLASTYGDGDDAAKLLPSALAAARDGSVFETSPGQQIREWLHVDDAADAVLEACTTPPPGRGAIVNIGTGIGVPLSAVVQSVFELAEADTSLVRLGARSYRAGEPHRLVMAPNRAYGLLRWRPTLSLLDGLTQVVRSTR